MKISFNIEGFSLEEQRKVYHYLKRKFELYQDNPVENAVSVKEVKEFPNKLKYALLRNGIDNVSDLLKLSSQDLINLRGIGPKSRKIIKRFCEKNIVFRN